jgi:hypothetical protein
MNFDINKYSVDELLDMFGLPSNYDMPMFEQRERKLRENIVGNMEVDEKTQKATVYFIEQVKKTLFAGDKISAIKRDAHSLFKPFSDSLNNQIAEVFNSNYDLKPVETDTSHLVQQRPDSSYSSSYPSDYFKGIINPLKKRVIKKQLNIDTRFRENYYSSPSTNFHFTLPAVFNDVLSMTLNAVELPTDYYNISKQMGNNFFYVGDTLVEIPSGNYKVPELLAAINDAIISTVAFTTNSTTNKTIVYNTSNIELDFQKGYDKNKDMSTPLPLKLGWLLGFRNGYYEGADNYVSEGIIDANGPRYMYLVVDDHNNSVNNSFYSAFNSSIMNKNVLARISINATSFNLVTHDNLNVVTLPRDYFGPVNIQHLTIQLLDEYGRVVDLNNMDFSFYLTFTTVYDL